MRILLLISVLSFLCIQVQSQEVVDPKVSNSGLNTFQKVERKVGAISKSREQISIYPNPATDHFQIQEKNYAYEIEIYNIVGKLMMSYSVVPGEKYNIERLKNGIYLVRFLSKKSKVIAVSRLSKR